MTRVLAFAGLLVFTTLSLSLALPGCGGGPESETDLVTDNPEAVPDDEDDAYWGSGLRESSGYEVPGASAEGGGGQTVSPQAIAANDRRARRHLVNAESRLEQARYDEADRALRDAVAERPLSENVEAELAALRRQLDVFLAAFAGIPNGVINPDLVVVVFGHMSTTEGVILDTDRYGMPTLIARTLGGYERIDPDMVDEVQPVRDREQRQRMAQRWFQLEQAFQPERASASGLDFVRMAREAWRLGQNEEAHDYMLEALARDPIVADTLLLEADPRYQQYTAAFTEAPQSPLAQQLLAQLMKEYPHAHIFQEARQQARIDAPAPGPETTDPAAETEVEDAETVAVVTEAAIEQAAAEAEADALEARADTRIEGIDDDLSGDPEDLLRRARSNYDQGINHDRRAMQEGDTQALQWAIYCYRLAQEQFHAALNAGADPAEVDEALTAVNRALFWARKRAPIH